MIKLNQKAEVLKNQWNELKPKEKRELISKDPKRAMKLRDKLYKAGYLKEGKEIVSLNNKKNGLSGQDLRQANKSQHEFLYNEFTLAKDRSWFAKVRKLYEEKKKTMSEKKLIKEAEKKIKKYLKEQGVHMSSSDLMKYEIPNPVMLKMGKKKYTEMRKQMNEIAGRGRLKPRELQEDIDAKWNEAMDEIKRINSTDDFGSAINQKALHYIRDFMEYRYFLNAPNHKQEQRIINEYLKMLTVQELYDIEHVLTDAKFKEQWDSNEDAENFDEDFNEKRQARLIKILRNETGKLISLDPKNPHGKLIITDYKPVGDYYTFQNFV